MTASEPLDLAREDSQPAQPQEQLVRAGEIEPRLDLEILGVDVGLVEAVEDHEAVGAGPLDPLRQVRERRIEGRELHRDRDRHGFPDGRDDGDGALLDIAPRLERVGRELVDVDLEGVGAGLLDQARVLDPALGGRAVQGRDHGDLDCRLDPLDLLQVVVRAEREDLRLGQVRRGFGMGLARPGVRAVGGELVADDLLLEERAQDDGGGARVLEAAHGIQVVGQRRGAGHQRMRQLEAEVRRREVHGHFAPPAGAGAGGGAAAAGAGAPPSFQSERCWYSRRRRSASWPARAASCL